MLSRPTIPILAWVLLVVAVLGLALARFDSFQLGAWTDDAKYVLLARSLVRGEEYALHIGPLPLATGYPFLFPLTLAPVLSLAPDRLGAVSLIATLINLALVFWGWPMLSGLRSRWWGLAAAALYGLAPQTISMASMVMSEPLFTTFVLLSLITCEWCARQPRPRFGSHALLGAAVTAAVFTRSAGVALVAAVALRLWWRRRRQLLRALSPIAAGSLLLLAPILALTPVAPRDLVPWLYLSRVPVPLVRNGLSGGALEQLQQSLWEYGTISVRMNLLPVGGGASEARLGEQLGVPALPALTGLAVTALVLAGALWSRGSVLRPSVLWFELVYLGVVLLWHHRGTRLLYPIHPFLAIQFLWGIRLAATWLVRMLAPRARPALGLPEAAAATAAAVVCLGLALRSLPLGPSIAAGHFVRDLRLGTTWLRDNGEQGALVLAPEPVSAHLYSGHPVVPESAVRSEEDVRRLGIEYVLLTPALAWSSDGSRHYDETTASVLLPLVTSLAADGKLHLVYESPPPEMVKVYRVDGN